jgi:cytochrome c oxidase cbb3-type subunit IV
MSDLGLVRGLIAIITLSTFLGICWWAYRPGNRTRFEEDGWLAFENDEIRAHSNRVSKDASISPNGVSEEGLA